MPLQLCNSSRSITQKHATVLYDIRIYLTPQLSPSDWSFLTCSREFLFICFTCLYIHYKRSWWKKQEELTSTAFQWKTSSWLKLLWSGLIHQSQLQGWWEERKGRKSTNKKVLDQEHKWWHKEGTRDWQSQKTGPLNSVFHCGRQL